MKQKFNICWKHFPSQKTGMKEVEAINFNQLLGFINNWNRQSGIFGYKNAFLYWTDGQ